MSKIPDISKKIRPLADRVVIKEDEDSAEKKTSSGIIIPVGAGNEDKNGKRGTVLAVGPGRTENGKLIAPSVKVGENVIFQWGDKVRIGDDDYYVVRESEILAVVK